MLSGPEERAQGLDARAARAPHQVRVAGHFGEWLQGRLGPQGPLALVTLTCPVLAVRAERLGPGSLTLIQNPQVIGAEPLARLSQSLGLTGTIRLRANMPPGGGAGASTAGLLALARLAGLSDPGELARLCHAIEGASDPLILARPDAVLWASRQGRVIEHIPPPPEAEILGGFWGPPQRTDPGDQDFPDISDLVAEWRAGPDLATAARLASASARRCSDLRGPEADPTPALVHELGALGHVRAHTGSARGLIFPPGGIPAKGRAALRAAGFAQVISFRSGGRG